MRIRTITMLAAFILCAASPAAANAAVANPAPVKASTVKASTVKASTVKASTVKTAVPGACTSKTKGVTEVVDFTKLGGTIEVYCDTGRPKTGLAALTGAGFHYGFVKKYPGFICTINSLPDPCNGAPVSAYWSYWHAPQGGPWRFSAKGAGDYDPAQGSVQGWAFGSGQAPGIAAP
jgi:hypothetical protein